MGAETANALVSILRGTDTDPYGDQQDDMQPYAQGVPATLIETTQTVQDPGTQTPRIIRSVTCLVPAWLGALPDDQVQDAAGNLYMVEDLFTQPSLTGAPADTQLVLKRVSGNSA